MKGPLQFNKEPYSMNMTVMFLHQILYKFRVNKIVSGFHQCIALHYYKL